MIHRCSLALIGKRGQSATTPTISPMDESEEDFLQRHLDRLREVVESSETRARFRAGSFLAAELPDLLVDDEELFLDVSETLVNRLSAAMEQTGNASACVVAVVSEGPAAGPTSAALLKLDAEVEAAQINQTEQGLRLRVFQDLLPRPGEIQKAFAWPDPRAPESELIVLDKVVAGSATKYFQNAFEIDVSPKAKDTEDALIEEILKLPSTQLAPALTAVADGGNAEDVVERVRSFAPSFGVQARELGGGGALPGKVRPGFIATAKRTFVAENIELRVPIDALDRVETRREGDTYVTSIRTGVPLTPIAEGINDVGGDG